MCIILLSCRMRGNENKVEPSFTGKIGEQGVVRKYLTKLDTSKFLFNNLTEILADYDWLSLEQIIELPINNGGDTDIRYLATVKSPFPANFKLYVIGFDEGGDCGPSYNLIATKNGLELSALILGQACAWENGHHSTTSKFINDSTFKITMSAAGRAEDLNGYIPDKTANRILTQTYKILSKGTFLLSDSTDRRWTFNKPYR